MEEMVVVDWIHACVRVSSLCNHTPPTQILKRYCKTNKARIGWSRKNFWERIIIAFQRKMESHYCCGQQQATSKHPCVIERRRVEDDDCGAERERVLKWYWFCDVFHPKRTPTLISFGCSTLYYYCKIIMIFVLVNFYMIINIIFLCLLLLWYLNLKLINEFRFLFFNFCLAFSLVFRSWFMDLWGILKRFKRNFHVFIMHFVFIGWIVYFYVIFLLRKLGQIGVLLPLCAKRAKSNL